MIEASPSQKNANEILGSSELDIVFNTVKE